MLADFSASVFCRIGGSAQACQAEYAGSIPVIGSNEIFQEIGRPDPKDGPIPGGRPSAAFSARQSVRVGPADSAWVTVVATTASDERRVRTARHVDFCDESVLTAIDGVRH